ncbi:cytochrome P450 [Actinomycetospora sp. TBRC 11914]|uniref:cytochrome P450 n=1 Tax=Actinomycetospora sp. TBRC 11914 TaxID=2729387 RepID=UPI00145F3445|nr:cytochrome P450 [Actinomycetospora sp. TBRC 11914]NMO88257.1 cytochrome P450 [Actinomycetospora sp. TBRC 11914]
MTAATLGPAPEDYDPFSPAVMADPLAFYRRLRDESPVHYLPAYDTFAISRFDDVYAVLGDMSGTFVSSESSLPSPSTLRTHNGGPVADPPTDPLGSANMFGSPVYETVRHASAGPLRAGQVRALADVVRDLACTRLDELLDRGGPFDLAQEYGGRVAAGMICHLLALPPELADDVLDVVNSSTGTNSGDGGLDKVKLFTRSLEILVPAVARHRAGDVDEGAPWRSRMIDGLLDLEFQGRRLDDREIATNLVCIFVGGTETVPKVTAHGLWELARHPDQLAAVRADPTTTLPMAREEFLRYCAPAQWFLRTVREPVEIGGVAVRPGQRVMSLIASANRDPREFDDPDAFRWNRPIPRQLSFGRGQHFCVGAHLARLEMVVLAEEFLARVGDYAVDEARAQRHPSSFQWGWGSVPVEAARA